MDLGSIVEFILWLSDSPPVEILRMVGYTCFAFGLWYMVLAGFHYTHIHYFAVITRWMNLGGAVHHTVVAVWAGLIAVQIPIPNREFTALLTVTTTMMLAGFVVALKRVIEDSRQ